MLKRNLKTVYAYIYSNNPTKDNGCVRIPLKNNKENIASFIFKSNSNLIIELTTLDNVPILDTCGNFLDRCYDFDYRDFIINDLVELQTFQKEPCEIKLDLIDESFANLEEIKKIVFDNTKYQL